MELMKIIVVLIFVIVLNIAVYISAFMLSNILFHRLDQNKFQLLTRMHNLIKNNDKEKLINKLSDYLTIITFYVILTLKGYTIYTMVILGVIAGLIYNIFDNYQVLIFRRFLNYIHQEAPLILKVGFCVFVVVCLTLFLLCEGGVLGGVLAGRTFQL